MSSRLVFNKSDYNHMSKLKWYAHNSDTLIIVSPFLAENLAEMIKQMPDIRHITLYTTLDKYDDTAQKVISLKGFKEWCLEKSIDLVVMLNDHLHGKAYLFYKGQNEKGFLITSGNFTQNGLQNNIEFGISMEDEEKQKELAKEINSMEGTYRITDEDIELLCKEAEEYRKTHPAVDSDSFKAQKYIDKKPKVTYSGVQNFFIKPIGTSQKPYPVGRILTGSEKMGFNDKPTSIKRGDVLICHAVGTGYVVGYYVVTDSKAIYEKWDDEDRWPWKVVASCSSEKFSSHWWECGLKTSNLRESFLEENPGKHITVTGTDSLGALQYGSDHVQITKEFAAYIIERIADAQKSKTVEDGNFI